jgi:precorrin-2 dehydrogenase/sirohydrochlorin ferrochelatase
MIPLFIDCTGKKVVIFGGGDVGLRKATLFAREARVTVVSRSFQKSFDSLPVEKIREEVASGSLNRARGYIRGSFLVIAALPDPVLNNAIGNLARNEGVLFNNAEGEDGDTLVPSVIQGDNYTIGISTHGKSPLMARYLRETIERECPDLDALIALQDRLRTALKKRGGPQEQRSRILEEVLGDRAIRGALARSGDEAWRIVEERYLGS